MWAKCKNQSTLKKNFSDFRVPKRAGVNLKKWPTIWYRSGTSSTFIERLIGTIGRDNLNGLLFWNRLDLRRKLARSARYDNKVRIHSALKRKTLAEQPRRAAPPESPCYGSSPGKNTVMASRGAIG
jgi:hypothetical protein